jgi:hypothetical protein
VRFGAFFLEDTLGAVVVVFMANAAIPIQMRKTVKRDKYNFK